MVGSKAETRACTLAVPRRGGCRGSGEDASTKAVDLLSGRGRQHLMAKETIKREISGCTALLRDAVRGTHTPRIRSRLVGSG